ncbi:hypothetical protein [Dolosigranulum savutiense]|uniref:Uncharacterized protein n=1 Tax=Dolosigranulum savutiense TaxID=3110288 RepID=A0AB74U4G4_9LACT
MKSTSFHFKPNTSLNHNPVALDNSGAEVVWQLKNKATGKNWSQITGDRHGATLINIDGMEKDIHSYKAIIDSERIEYIHGKFING